MERQRQLDKECIVGEYAFKIAVNRQMVLDAFKHTPELWNTINKISKSGVSSEDINDIETLATIMADNDIVDREKPKFVSYILPRMVELAEENIDCEEFIAYCEENAVDDIVYDNILEFAMLGFTEGRSAKKPKVAVKFN